MLLYELFVRLAIYIIHRGVVWQVNQTIASAARSYEDSMMMAGGGGGQGQGLLPRVLNQVSLS